MTSLVQETPLRIIPLGGLGEIGLNCMLFEYEDEAVVVDCGVMFSDLQMLGVDFFIPDFTYLQSIQKKISGYLITHAHEDHIGALPYALKVCPAPIYCTDFAQRLIESKLSEHSITAKYEVYSPGDEIQLKHFKIRPVWVNHSIVEATALILETPQGKIIHTGDFKFDASPYYGEPLDPKPFELAGEEGVRLLLSDSTNVEREGCSQSEEFVFEQMKTILPNAKGLTIVAVFASNIGRIGQILEIARKLGKKIALLGRSMDQNCNIALEAGYLEGMQELLIAQEDIKKYPRSEVIVLSTGSQGEYRSGLVRISQNEHKFIRLTKGDLVILSSKFIPGNEKAIGIMINNLFRQGAEVLYEPVAHTHVSGHANADELSRMIQMTRPEYFIPVHGEYRHLVRHRKLAVECGIPDDKSILAVNGDVIEVTSQGIACVDHLEENRVMIEGSTGDDVTKVIVKDRRKVAETGIVFAVLIRNSVSGKLLADPDILSRGFLDHELQRDLIDDAKSLMLDIVTEVSEKKSSKSTDLQEEVRVGLRRFFNQRIGKKPVVMPVLVDV